MALALLLAVMPVAGALYGAGYDAQEEAIVAMAQGVTQERVTAFGDADSEAGLIFYPGGLVDHAVYRQMKDRPLRSRSFAV